MSKTKSVESFLDGLITEGTNRSADNKGNTLPAKESGTKVNDPSDGNLNQGGPDQLAKGDDNGNHTLKNVGTKTAKKRPADKTGVKLEAKDNPFIKKDKDGKSDGDEDKDDDKDKKVAKEAADDKGESDGDEDDDDKKVAKEATSDGESDGGEDDEDDKKKMKEHVDAMFGTETLPEDFKNKATLIFESAVNERVTAKKARLAEDFNKTLIEKNEEFKLELAEKVNDYLDYVVEQWLGDNKLAVERALRSELSESLITGMREVFEAHYIDLPEEKIDAIGELTSKVESLDSKLNEQTQKNVELNKQLNEQKKAAIFTTVVEGLASTEKDKMKALCENVVFDNADDYKKKLEVIKGSYYSKTTTAGKDINEATHTQAPASTGNSEIERIAEYASRRMAK